MLRKLLVYASGVLIYIFPFPHQTLSVSLASEDISFDYVQRKITFLQFFSSDEITPFLKNEYVEKYFAVISNDSNPMKIRAANINMILHYQNDEIEQRLIDYISMNPDRDCLLIQGIAFPRRLQSPSEKIMKFLAGCLDRYIQTMDTSLMDPPLVFDGAFVYCVFLVDHPYVVEFKKILYTNDGVKALRSSLCPIDDVTDSRFWLSFLNSEDLNAIGKRELIEYILFLPNKQLGLDIMDSISESQDIDLKIALLSAFYLLRFDLLISGSTIEGEQMQNSECFAEYRELLGFLLPIPELYRDPFIQEELFNIVAFAEDEELLNRAEKYVTKMANTKVRKSFASDVKSFQESGLTLGELRSKGIRKYREQKEVEKKLHEELVEKIRQR